MRMVRSILPWLWLLAAIALAPAGALAQGSPSDEDIQKAKKYFKRAQKYQELEDYERAAGEYLKAYDHFPNAEFLFNAGETYRLAGESEKALKYFEQYLAEEPNGRGAPAARKAVKEIEKKLADEKAAGKSGAGKSGTETTDTGKSGTETTGTGTTETGKSGTETTETGESGTETTETGKSGAETTGGGAETTGAGGTDLGGSGSGTTGAGDVGVSKESSSSGSGLRIAGIATAGGGVLALGLGVYFGLEASSLSDDLSGLEMWSDEVEKKEKDGESAETNSILFTSIGAAALIAGGALYYLGMRQGEEKQPSVVVVPTASDSSVGASAAWRF